MKRLKEYFQTFVYPFTLILLVGLLLTIAIYKCTHWAIGYDILNEVSYEKRLDGIVKILGVSISITGFVSIIVTIIQSRESIKRDIQKNSVDLFKELRNKEFIDARKKAWLVKEKWYNLDGYKQELITHNFTSNKASINTELDEEIQVVYRLLEFYLLVSIYEGNENVLKALRYFYYGWWRHFLYDFASEIENNTKTNNILRESEVEYLHNISYTATLKRLDKLCGLQKIPEETILHFDGG